MDPLMTINWVEQWELFAPGFSNGFLPLHLNGVELQLKPGPGFGDLSHETTQLMMEYLPQVVADCVIDIGCGSGILSVAAKSLGAKEVVGIDICPDSLLHAKENASHNKLEIEFLLPEHFQSSSKGTLLMNMIYSEQKIAWDSLPQLHAFKGDLIISGLLKRHKKQSIEFWTTFGWHVYSMKTKNNWILIHFKN